MFRVLIIGVLFLACCTTAPVTQHTQSIPSQKSRQGFDNSTLENDKFPCVISLHKNDGGFVGSGVLISPYYILTAGHCISRDDITEVHLFDGRVHCVRELIQHEQHAIGPFIINDIGIIALDEPILDVKTYDLCSNILGMYKFQDVDICGYGGNWKKQSQFGMFKFYGILLHESDLFKILPIQGSVWFGDSGGGAFAYIDGKKQLIGIISSFSAMKINGSNVIIENSFVRVDRYIPWISKVISETPNEIQ